MHARRPTPSYRKVIMASVLAAFSGHVMADATAPSALVTRAVSHEAVFNGVTVSNDGRIFAVFPHIDGSRGMFIGEYEGDGQWKPYPDAPWNEWVPGERAKDAFISANALRMGPDGALWVVDMGSPKRDGKRVPGGARLIRIDIARNAVTRSYPLDAALPADGTPNDVRFNGSHAYLTDSGHAGLVVVDLVSGAVRRVLDGAEAVSAHRVSRFAGTPMMLQGKPAKVQADQLEVSPDGKWLYFQPAAGPMSRVSTALIDNASTPARKLEDAVTPFADTPPTGGTAIDAKGNIYLSDVDHPRILRIAPDGTSSVAFEDPQLVWIDAMWIDAKGNLWLPDAQLGRTAPYHDGQSQVRFPLKIYSLPLGLGQRL